MIHGPYNINGYKLQAILTHYIIIMATIIRVKYSMDYFDAMVFNVVLFFP
jgi:hypothetical protein